MSKLINITVTDKIARLTDKSSKIVCNNSNYKVVFDFDKEWDAFPLKTAVIEYGKYRETRIFEGNECELPPIIKARVAKVGVFAGDIRTTTPAVIECEKSILDGEGLPPDPPPDVYKQIMDMLNTGGGTGQGFTTDETLTLKDGVLSVNRATAVEKDNTLPITAAAVHTTVGNIEVLLGTI